MSLMNTMSVSISGMRAAANQMALSAHNVANAQTPGFRADRMTIQELPSGGVTTSAEPVAVGAPVISPSQTLPLSNVDLSLEVINQMLANQAFKANSTVLRSVNEETRDILRLVA
jgi:flagellar hook protein FlgE